MSWEYYRRAEEVTRMSKSPKDGVVNSHCKIHGVENIFIGSSSVFPPAAIQI
jgi:choline dehydrogenase-like flavoprotein